MNFARKPPALQNTTQFTRDQVKEVGCCFQVFPQTENDSRQANRQPFRSCSEPRIKKIELTVAKKRKAQSRDNRGSGRISPVKKTFSMAQLKFLETTTGHSSLTSKLTTQKNSLRSSRVKICSQASSNQATTTGRYDKYLNICNQVKPKPMEITFSQSRGQLPSNSIQMLSEISLVEQEFISHESTTLKALNLLSNQTERKSIERTATPCRFQLETIPENRKEEVEGVKNPLQRLLEKKRFGRGEEQKLRLM